MKKTINQIFYGRYGNDHLSMFLYFSYLWIRILSMATNSIVLVFIAISFVILGIFRTISRNIPARQRENQRYLKTSPPFLDKINQHMTTNKDKTHCYLRCPNCAQRLRVPKGKGEIMVTCSHCGKKFPKIT